MPVGVNLLMSVLVAFGMFVGTWWLTGHFLRYAIAVRLFDVPNSRSSHAVATPRGGGLAIALTVLGGLMTLGALGAMPWQPVWGLVGGGALVTLIGFRDDCRHVSPPVRLLAHFTAAAWVLAWLDVTASVPMFGHVLEPWWLAYGTAALYLVWLLNLTNFMDGIDGLAAVEAISVSAGGALIHVLVAERVDSWLGPLALASATLGFLVWNVPPAKIFMGDAGSGFLGLMLAAFSLQAGSIAPALVWSWLILFGVFVVDATITLVRRMARRERFYQAHRSHAYQHAAERLGAHRPVTLIVGTINVCWLFPMALLVARGHLDGGVGIVMAYTPLAAAALWLKAGAPSSARPTAFDRVHDLTDREVGARSA
jgi:Fuc2NAc and GlcNAc transferase